MNPLYHKDYVELSCGATDFGVRDKKGRAVGYSWRIFDVTYTEVSGRSGYIKPEGFALKHLEVAGYPTRDGNHYGASTRNVPCVTQAEAEAIIAKRTAQARKRETKRFGAALAVLALCLSLGACNTVSEAWKRPGSSADQTNRSFDECRYEAQFARGRSDQEGFVIQQCMALRGYSRERHFWVR